MLVGLLIGMWLLPDWDLGTIVLIVIACFIPLTPLVTRYSRVFWIYFDRWAWPPRKEELNLMQSPEDAKGES